MDVDSNPISYLSHRFLQYDIEVEERKLGLFGTAARRGGAPILLSHVLAAGSGRQHMFLIR